MLFFWDPWYLLFVAPGVILALWAQWRVKSTFARASEMTSRRGWSGRQVAQAILDANGINDVEIEPVSGYLSDHYDPRAKVLRLSPEVYEGRSLAAFGVAAHECGHAIQDARGYALMGIRNAAVPLANIGSSFSFILLMVGIGLGLSALGKTLAIVGCALFSMVVFFQVVNLPVEFNASSRAREVLLANGMVSREEDHEIGRVLHAAAMTYVAATLTAILTLLYYLMRSGVIGGRSR
jgi:Zn-dependent membrane protease YugP